jgi:thioesterase domain-containing protein
LWVRAGDQDPVSLATDILSLLEADDYGVMDRLPEAASAALGTEGRAAMRQLILKRREGLPGDQRRRYDYKANWLLPKLADLDDDVDAYIATVDPARSNALLNEQVAKRLIAHDRAEEALGWIDAPTERSYNEHKMMDLRLEALKSLGRKEEVQAQRWHIFERWLDQGVLRTWLKDLPAFEDFEAEQSALDFAVGHTDAVLALDFLVTWPDQKRAAKLVRQRLDQLTERRYDVLRPAAAALEADYPGASTLLYRRLVAEVVDRGASKYYPYAARDYHSAAALAEAITSDSTVPAHADWGQELRRRHGRKIGFWSLVDGKASR